MKIIRIYSYPSIDDLNSLHKATILRRAKTNAPGQSLMNLHLLHEAWNERRDREGAKDEKI